MAEIKIEKEHGIFYECPECGHDVELGQNHCQDCGEPIEWLEENSMSEDYYNQVRIEMERAGILESDIVAAISIIKKLRNED